jgi:transcriptional regulator with XRE-family HTH domain
MKDRITLLIKAKNLTAAQFADEINVQKSSISHIISGRNNASLDFIQKILFRYPEVNMEWLMFGKGTIFKDAVLATNTNNDVGSNAVSPPNTPPVDLFSGLSADSRPDFRNVIELNNEAEKIETQQEENKLNDSFSPVQEKREPISNSTFERKENLAASLGHKNTTTRTIIKIVEFYSDNTYKEYFPE